MQKLKIHKKGVLPHSGTPPIFVGDTICLYSENTNTHIDVESANKPLQARWYHPGCGEWQRFKVEV